MNRALSSKSALIYCYNSKKSSKKSTYQQNGRILSNTYCYSGNLTTIEHSNWKTPLRFWQIAEDSEPENEWAKKNERLSIPEELSGVATAYESVAHLVLFFCLLTDPLNRIYHTLTSPL